MREFLDLPGHIEEEIRFGACEFRSYQVFWHLISALNFQDAATPVLFSA